MSQDNGSQTPTLEGCVIQGGRSGQHPTLTQGPGHPGPSPNGTQPLGPRCRRQLVTCSFFQVSYLSRGPGHDESEEPCSRICFENVPSQCRQCFPSRCPRLPSCPDPNPPPRIQGTLQKPTGHITAPRLSPRLGF